MDVDYVGIAIYLTLIRLFVANHLLEGMFESNFLSGLTDDEVEMIPILSVEEAEDGQLLQVSKFIPILPLRNNVLFPGVVIPISVGRDKSIKAIKKSHKTDKLIGVVAQKEVETEEPEGDDLYRVGTIARIVKMLKMPDGGTTLIIQGVRRFRIVQMTASEPYLEAEVELLPDPKEEQTQEVRALMSSMKDLAGKIIDLSPNLPSEAKFVLNNISDLNFLTHFIASNLPIDLVPKQEVIELVNISERAQRVMHYLHEELEMLMLKDKIQSKVKHDLEKQQRDYFLHQQMKTIQEELGGDNYQQEINDMKEKAKTKKWPADVSKTFEKEVLKLQRINPAAAEYTVILNYLELLLELPWDEITKDNFDLKRAQRILDDDHYGLEKIKTRILEYLAVLKLKGDMKSPILCFVGPPGVGKTSLGRSIAKSLNRKYVRMALGGIHDESEIRGHRKTYIGAMPGRVIQSLKKVQSSNPVFILDEIDKVGKDHRGDPSSALLEVLDPEQNNSFYDNYLELEYDLSKVLFIATANDLGAIPGPLRDRMEVIYLSGYPIEEKIEIARKHLVKKQLEAHGLKSQHVKINAAVIRKLIEDYTRESGVRGLDREIAAVMRNIAKHVAMEEAYEPVIKPDELEKMLGKKKFSIEEYDAGSPPGVSIGLAWTAVGGDILFIESTVSRGKGAYTITGNLGNVMKESADTAFTYLRSKADQLGIPHEAFKDWNLHIHFPEGAQPKDGPSAGIAILTALASLYTQRRVKTHMAFSGEITLRGKVLPVGGIREKVLAARRSGIKHIVLCAENRKDVEEIKQEYLKGLSFHYVSLMEEVLDFALEKGKIKQPLVFNTEEK
jgi:ATP-dependent Lon protease